MADERTSSALVELVEGAVAYLAAAQERDGPYAGAFWSELAYHCPHFDYHAGGSHHNRTPGSAGLAFLKLADQFPSLGLRARAERAFDWICTRQHGDGGLFEITNNDEPSRFHLDHERSSISLGVVTHGLYTGFALGLPRKPAYIQFLTQAAHWQMTVAVAPPGNFLHSEGYPLEYLILNSCAHAAETLLVAAQMTDDPLYQSVWQSEAARAISAILAAQRESGMFPYRVPDANQHTISYTATCVWVLQNLIDAELIPPEDIENSLQRASAFLAESVDADGRLLWDGREVHGQKYHTWVYGMVARCLAWWGREEWHQAVRRMLLFVHGELYEAEVGLARLLDFPLGESRNICGHTCTSKPDYACAFNQADMLDCLVDLQRLVG